MTRETREIQNKAFAGNMTSPRRNKTGLQAANAPEPHLLRPNKYAKQLAWQARRDSLVNARKVVKIPFLNCIMQGLQLL